MKKEIKISFAIFFLISACSSMKGSMECHENMEFKNTFFYNISVIEKYTLEQQSAEKRTVTTKDFLKSLSFIDGYAKMPVANVYNYQIGYASMELFQKDKVKWLEWYDVNKCNNLR